MTVFQTHTLCLPRASLNPKLLFSQKPNKNSSSINSKFSPRYVSSFFSLYFLRLSLRFYVFICWVHFWKGRENFIFMQNLLIFLIRFYPIVFDCVCVGPKRHYNMYLGKIFTCSCIVLHGSCVCATKLWCCVMRWSCTTYAHLMHILVHLKCFAYHSC